MAAAVAPAVMTPAAATHMPAAASDVPTGVAARGSRWACVTDAEVAPAAVAQCRAVDGASPVDSASRVGNVSAVAGAVAAPRSVGSELTLTPQLIEQAAIVAIRNRNWRTLLNNRVLDGKMSTADRDAITAKVDELRRRGTTIIPIREDLQ